MPKVYATDGIVPVVDPSSFVHPTAVLIGDVVVGPECYIGPGASLRADMGRIVMKKGSNFQDNCVAHTFAGGEVVLEEKANIGHGAILHGCHIHEQVLVGMNSVIMDGAVVGENAIIGALSLVPAEMQVPDRKIAVGNPAKVVKEASDETVKWKTEGTELYRTLPRESHASLKELRIDDVLSDPAIPDRDPYNGKQKALFKTWDRSG